MPKMSNVGYPGLSSYLVSFTNPHPFDRLKEIILIKIHVFKMKLGIISLEFELPCFIKIKQVIIRNVISKIC